MALPRVSSPPTGPATASVLGTVKVSGGIASAGSPTVRSGDNFQVGVVANDITVTASTTLVDVTGLGVTLGASATEVWFAKYWLLISAANAAMDIKVGFPAAPSSAALYWGPIMGNSTVVAGWITTATSTAPAALKQALQSVSMGTTGAGVAGVELIAIILGGGTGGAVQIQFAQDTSDAGALKILKGSIMEAQRVAV